MTSYLPHQPWHVMSHHGLLPSSSSTSVVAPSPSRGDDGLPMPMVTPSNIENNDTTVQDQPWYFYC